MGLGPAHPTVVLVAWLHTDRLAQRLATNAAGPDTLGLAIGLWLEQAEPQSIRRATAHVIEHASYSQLACLKPGLKGRKPEIRASLGLTSLEEALEWVIWNSYWLKNPLMFCRECHRAFRPETAHRRKYDTPGCAHRATART